MLRWTWRELETHCIVVARQFSTLPMSGVWKRSNGARYSELVTTAPHLDSTDFAHSATYQEHVRATDNGGTADKPSLK